MTLATFYSEISASIRRGTTQDARIPGWARKAVRFHEQNIDFRHMLRWGEVTVDPLATSPEVISLPNNRVKDVLLLQPYTEGFDGTRVYGCPVGKGERQRYTPGAAYLWSYLGDTIVLSDRPTEAISFEILWTEYTAWPTDTAQTPTFLRDYETLLEQETLYRAWMDLKDTDSAAARKVLRDEALAVVAAAEENRRWQGQKLAMGQGSAWTGGRDQRLFGIPQGPYPVGPIDGPFDFVATYDEARD